MSEYVIDEKGKWKKQGNHRILIEPSQEYLQQKIDEEKLSKLMPILEEIKQAEFEIKTINLLTELGVI
jgi:hypothetical protein